MSTSIQPPATPPRPLFTGTLTLAHLKPRAPAPVTGAFGLAETPTSRDEVQAAPRARVALPLKGDKPKALAVRKKGSGKPAPTVQAKPSPVPARPERTEEEGLLWRFHRLCRERWRTTFPMRNMTTGHIEVPPLALGVREEITAALAGLLDAEQVNLCLKRWTTRRAYLEGTVRHFEAGLPRVRPDGTPTTDLITTQQANRARYLLAQRLLRLAARDQETQATQGEATA